MALISIHERLAQGNAVVVRVPGEVMYSAERSQAVVRSVLGRLGCPGCHSGIQILLQGIEQEFEASAQAELRG